MPKKIKIGIIKETKSPIDTRTPFTAKQIKRIQKLYPNTQIIVQSSNSRYFTDEEYKKENILVNNKIDDCNILFGIKEVEIKYLIPEKTYFFFSHTAKMQLHNRKLLKEIIRKKITLIDYEYLTDKNNIRLVAFGYWAGLVGAYNGIKAYGIKNKLFDLKPAKQCKDLKEIENILKIIHLPACKILITGGGKAASGAKTILKLLGIKQIKPQDYLNKNFVKPVFCQIEPDVYIKHKKGKNFNFRHFVQYPEEYESAFKPFTKVSDIYLACHFWDPRSPVFLTKNDYKQKDFKISIIADISCDINGPIPSTMRASTIENPYYGYDPINEKETGAFNNKAITVMAVDNLPAELPRDSSEDFGKDLIEKILPHLL
ncbi:MAG: hypothetical protein JXB17_00710, partial [Bacteroidales bacterium]|nr:hypothetical protein [Bacteroidales bacterium]